MKYCLLSIFLILISCNSNTTVQLPKGEETIISEIRDWSPIYFFYKIENNDTIAVINKSNSILSTHWIFNIDKRLSLHHIMPDLLKLQAKRLENSVHKNERAQNYFAYADSKKSSLAFIPFTHIFYTTNREANIDTSLTFNTRQKKILLNNSNEGIEEKISSIISDRLASGKAITILFDKEMSFEHYLQCQIILYKILSKFNVDKHTEIIF